jgi:hypothetical protein
MGGGRHRGNWDADFTDETDLRGFCKL